jgi:hypothetical protein
VSTYTHNMIGCHKTREMEESPKQGARTRHDGASYHHARPLHLSYSSLHMYKFSSF